MLIVLLLSPRFSWLALGLLALPILIDGGVQYAGGYESTNIIRLITGILGGVATSYFLGYVADRSLTVKKTSSDLVEKR
jgi:uncharacterized membrane protein